jgi:thymidylate synthase
LPPDDLIFPRIITDTTIKGLRYKTVKAIRADGYFLKDQRKEETQELYNLLLVLLGTGCDQSDDPLTAILNTDFAEGLIYALKAWLKDQQFDYSYGAQMRKQEMLKKVIEMLRRDHSTRRGWIPILHPEQVGSKKEIPCCVGMDLKIRDEKLLMTTVFRSNEMFQAAQSDIYGYRMLQKYIAWLLRVEVGIYCQLSISAHLRMSDMDGIDRLLAVA